MNMKKIFCTATLSALLSVQAFAQYAAKFDSTAYDFGTIREGDGIVKCNFNYTNASSDTLYIQSVATSCGCTATRHNKTGVAPGQRDSVVVSFDPSGLSQEVFRYVYVCFKGVDECQELVFRANVEPSPLTMNQLYPIRINDSVGVVTRQIDWNYITYGTQASKTVMLANLSSKMIRVEMESDNRELDIDCPRAIRPGKVEPVVLSYNIDESVSKIGPRHDIVHIYIDGKEERSLLTDAHVTDKPSMNGNEYASIHCSETDFHISGNRKLVKLPVIITNVGQTPLIIRHIENGFHSRLDLNEGTVIQPGQLIHAYIKVQRETAAERKQGYEFIHLYTNAPMRLVYQLRVIW